MGSIVVQLIESKGIQVPRRDHSVLKNRWRNIQSNNPTLDELVLTTEDIVFQCHSKGDIFDE